ncbi:BCCT family transporter [Demetria terragena]|uniref:BCCT family transporter n=1 Tax=Demetria terragena TaxID=63959 RepID=UPI000381160E|nr:BCCT family transporter [Demetria terragena]
MSAPSSSATKTESPPGGGLSEGIFKPVFIPASVAILGLITIVVIFRDQAEDATGTLNQWVTDGVGWWYVIAVNIFLIFCFYCAFSRIGRIRLGRDDEQPEFGIASWFMMLFSAGMGIGLVFFGVAEPLTNFITPPEAYGDAPQSMEAAQHSVGLMMLQWGLHPWGIYAVVGLGLAYMSFRRGRPLAVRWLLEPLIGRQRVEGWMGHAIDTIAIVGTLFGIATSFGFGVSQLIAGLEFLGWAEESNELIIGLIAAITGIAIWSVVSGVHKGLKWLSNINMTIAASLALVIFIVGPTIFFLKAIPDNFGEYITILPDSMFHTGPFSSDGWEATWPLGYWGWWTSWAPFVGMFIARISRGRTIREFIVGVLLAPTMASLVWFTIFGGGAIFEQRENKSVITNPDEGVNSTTALFQYFDTLPMTTVLSITAMAVVVFFFVTSSDSGSLVIDMLASGGRVDTPVATRVYWAALEGVAAAVLLVVGGDAALTALQTLSISTAAPFSVIMVLGCVSMLRAFRHDVANMPNYIQVIPRSEDQESTEMPQVFGSGAKSRLRSEVRSMAGVSSTMGGLSPAAGQATEVQDPQIISFRNLDASDMTIDPETGEHRLDNEVVDPLAGEVFDTPEFESSQEYVNQGGVVEVAQDEDDQPEPTR